jgi:hypothetical protein
MSQQSVVRGHEYRCHVDHESAQRNAAAALVGCAHEQDAVCGHLDRAVLFEGASAGRIRVDERLCVLVKHTVESTESTLTLLTIIPPRLCATKMIGRLVVYFAFSA